MFSSLRHRLAATSFALVVGVCALCAIGLYVAFEVAEDTLFDAHIQREIDDLLVLYAHDPGIVTVPQKSFQIYTARAGDTSGLPADLRALAPDVDEVMRDGREYDIHIERRADTTLYFLSDESDFDAFERTFFGAMSVIVLSVIALAGWVSIDLARRATQPLTALAAQVAALDDHSATITLTPQALRDDAIASLAQAIDGYHRRVSVLLHREREFSGDVSHELRTPLMAIQGAAELLARRATDDPAVVELAQRIRRGCGSMIALTEALLYLARDPTSFKDMLEPVSVERVVEQQLAALQDIAARKGITLNVERCEGPTMVEAIPAVINIVIGNILKNAVKYTDRDLISVFLRPREVVVQDYGPGIDLREQASLFDRHHRGSQHEADGNGIGLALVRRFCDEYGWAIDFRSEVNIGTRVAVAF